MSVLAVGLSHRTADVRTLERAAVSGADLPKLLDELLGCANVSEVAVVSTCNRVEVYAAVETFHGGLSDVSSVLSRAAGCETQELVDNLYVYYSGAAIEHLFSVTSGLDSMVVGEPQILGQVRAAYQAATERGAVGQVLHELIQTALRVGKRVHSETGIDHAGASVVSEALEDAKGALGGLEGRTALLVGAGAMSGLAAAHLRRAGVGEIIVANRTMDNARRLAANIEAEGTDARAAGLDTLTEQLRSADVVVTATGASEVVLDAETVRSAVRDRLVLCDLGLPRDIAPEVAELPGTTIVDIESLQRRLTNSRSGEETRIAREIVTREVKGYLDGQRSAAVTPTVTALRKRAAEVVDAEMLRLDAKLPELDDQVRAELGYTVRRVVDKLLHTPTVRVKELASDPGGIEYADALRELFNLDPNAPVAVSETEGGPR
ncbi:glutamyl-tRNA reductase [Sciscionella sediminilitoris]|uniref:glutamyl-tRNA reductase n=1 Tax=Sciscionella sediminilitoris TaxID=1445613 RepID=UPI0004DF982E|nr:glutamyl-tRNA reductase [Sciscionella sp. SE31]